MLLNCGVGEDSWESLGLQDIQPVHPKGNQSWIFIGRTDVEVETPILWPPDANNWLIWKAPDAGKDWRQEEKRTTKMRWLDHWLDGHEFEQTPKIGDGQGSLVCCSTWGHKESDMSEQVNNEQQYSSWDANLFSQFSWNLGKRRNQIKTTQRDA